jgi:hypothetical protein
LNRPDKLNALSFPLVRELDEALTEYEKDDDIKAVILTGAGDRAFSAGADIHEMAGLSNDELATRQEVRGRATWHIATFAKPLIGAINGLAYGGAALLSSTLRSADQLRALPISLPGGELWPGYGDAARQSGAGGHSNFTKVCVWGWAPKRISLSILGQPPGAKSAYYGTQACLLT